MAHTHQAQRESVQRENVMDPRLKGAPNCKFIYVHWPGQFELIGLSDDEFELLPRVRRVSLNPGAMGVKWLRHDSTDLADVNPLNLYMYLESQGAIRIPDNAHVCYTDGDEIYEDPEPGYLWSMPLANGKKLFIDPWDNPTQKRGGGIDFSGRDIVGFRAWLRMLMANGTIPEPTSADLGDLIKLQSRRAERHANKSAGNPVLQERVEREKARLVALLAEQKKRSKAVTKRRAPKRKRGNRESTDA